MTKVITDTKSNEAKRLVEQLKTIDYVEVVDVVSEDSENYNTEFVDMIKQREKQDSVKLDSNDL